MGCNLMEQAYSGKTSASVIEPHEIATVVRFVPDKFAQGKVLLGSAHLNGQVKIMEVNSEAMEIEEE